MTFPRERFYSRKEAAWGQPSPYPPWSDIQPLLIRGSIFLLAGAAALAVFAHLEYMAEKGTVTARKPGPLTMDQEFALAK